MEVQGKSYYINPNTRTLTTNLKNTQVYDQEAASAVFSQLRPAENMEKILATPLNLSDRTSVSKNTNSVNIAFGASWKLPGGFTMTVRKYGVEVTGQTNGSNLKEAQEASDMAGALGTLLRNAGGTWNDVGFSTEERASWTENVSKALNYLGIDTSKDFTVNGMQYTKGEDGNFVSQAKQDAMEAYEKLKSANQTYRFADERTKTAINYISHYYLKTAPESVVNAWNETLEETGINPFPEGHTGVLQQLAMEQDFATDGNDNLFGDTEESSRKAVEAILERIDNPTGTIRSVDRSFYADQRTFYTTLLAKLKGEE